MVNSNTASSVKLDFWADKSLHTATSGEYVFAPVVEIEARKNTTVKIDSQKLVKKAAFYFAARSSIFLVSPV